MKVGEVARRAGVNVETLRYYERRGLLPLPEREPSGHRSYDEDTVRLLRAIKEAQAVGLHPDRDRRVLPGSAAVRQPVRDAARPDGVEDRRDRRPDRGPAADAGGARTRRRLCDS